VLILFTEHGIEMRHGHESCDVCRDTLAAARRVVLEAKEIRARLRAEPR
jgi:HJR/Mrr/RecB family endonuclease